MANMQVAIRFRWESGQDFAPCGFEVGLQLGRSVGYAHLTPACLGAESHHLVHLRVHTHTYLQTHTLLLALNSICVA